MDRVKKISMVLLFLAACSGQGNSNLQNPLGTVPDESVLPGLKGYWSLEGIVTESDCEQIRVGETLPDRPTLTVDESGCLMEDNETAEGKNVSCEAGGETVGVIATMTGRRPGCELHEEERLILNFNEATNELTGQGELTVSGSCPPIGEEFGSGCRIKIDIAGSPFDPNIYSVPYTEEPTSELEIPVSDPVLESLPEPTMEPTVDSAPETEDESEPATESEPEEAPTPGPRIVFNPAIIQWAISMCEGVVCGEGERCIFGRCVER